MAERMSDERLAQIAKYREHDVLNNEELELLAEVERLRAVQEKVEEFAKEMMQSDVHKFMGEDLRDLIGGSDE